MHIFVPMNNRSPRSRQWIIIFYSICRFLRISFEYCPWPIYFYCFQETDIVFVCFFFPGQFHKIDLLHQVTGDWKRLIYKFWLLTDVLVGKQTIHRLTYILQAGFFPNGRNPGRLLSKKTEQCYEIWRW